MSTVVAHPAELVDLDLFEVWSTAELPDGEFDPFAFEQRMAAYRLLVEASNPHGAFGADHRKSPLWGLMFQHQWQFRTGRVGAAGSSTRGRIDPDAPWGYGNYTLCVVPWLGAVEAGLVPDRLLVPPGADSRFEYADGEGASRVVPRELRAGVADWAAFFRLAVTLRPGDDLEPASLALWKAHKSCLDAAAAQLRRLDPTPYSAGELEFLLGWCRMVDYLWAAAWPTDFDFMREHGMEVLPERLLEDDDAMADQPDEVRRNVRNILALARTSQSRYDLNLWMWRRMMRSRAARRDVVAMLDAIFRPRLANAPTRARALLFLLRP